MIRAMLIATAAVVGLWAFGAATVAEDKANTKTVTGTLMCAKCKLKIEGFTDCQNALQVKEGDKTVTYFIEDKGNGEDYHECGKGTKEGVTVAGVVTEKDGKKWIKPSKVTVPAAK